MVAACIHNSCNHPFYHVYTKQNLLQSAKKASAVKKFHYCILLVFTIIFFSCKSFPDKPSTLTSSLTTISTPDLSSINDRAAIEELIESGYPTSIEKAINYARNSKNLSRDDKAAYIYAALETMRVVYPLTNVPVESEISGTQSHPIVKAITAIRMGRAATITETNPFYDFLISLSIFRTDNLDTSKQVILAIDRFRVTKKSSAVIELASGILSERKKAFKDAEKYYFAASSISAECYPALFGMARVRLELGNITGTFEALSILEPSYGSFLEWKKLKGITLFKAGLFDEALPIITKSISEEPYSTDLLLMRATILYEKGLYRQVQPLLDAFGTVKPNDKEYLLLRAKNLAYGLNRREEGLTILRKALLQHPSDKQIETELAYILSLGNSEEISESGKLANKLYANDPANKIAFAILIEEDVKQKNWKQAEARIERMRSADPAWENHSLLYKVYHEVGRIEEANNEANAWFAENPNNEDAIRTMARILIFEKKDIKKATNIIQKALSQGGSLKFRSDLYYLSSFYQNSDEAIISALRSSLVENIENIEALTALYDIYFRTGDYKQARFYLKLAIQLSPSDNNLIRKRNELMLKGIAFP